MSHCSPQPLANTRSMAISGAPSIRNTVKTSVRNFASIARNELLCSPDVDSSAATSIVNGDLLQWDTSKGPVNYGAFVNVTPQSANITLANNAKEFFISNGGNDNASGDISSTALSTFQRALYHADRTEGFEGVVFYVNGDVTWNPASNIPGYRNQSRLREGSFGGNLSSGIIIRGLNNSYSNVLTPSDPPRSIPSQLVAQSPQTNLEFIADAAYSLGNAVAYDFNMAATEVVPFYRDTSAHFYPVAFDTTAHTTPLRRVYLTTNGSQPDVTSPGNLRPYKFAGKVTMNNGGTTANPGFAMTGNVQFVEVHFELQDGVKTPYYVNGEFNILYSMFSKTAGSDGATLELSASGNSTDHLSTLHIDPTSANTEGKPVIQIYKSIFKDLTINFTSPTQISDCVFIGCRITNANRCNFKGCTFFNYGISGSAAISLGSDEFLASIRFGGCQFQYGTPAASLALVGSGTYLELSSVMIRATANTNVAQINKLIGGGYNATVLLDNVKIRGKLNNEAATDAAILSCTSTNMVTVRNVDVAGDSGTIPLFSVVNTRIEMYNISDACTNTGPLLRTKTADVSIIDFDVASADYTVASGGIFEFDSSTVRFNGIFGLVIKSGVTTTQTIFSLHNTIFRNFPSAVPDGKFNVQNALDKHFMIAWGSDIILDITHTSPQLDIHGAITLDHSTCRMLCSQAAGATLNYQGANGLPTIKCNDSEFSMKNISIDGMGGGGSTTLDASNRSTVILDTCVINNVGFTGKSTILVDNSSLTITGGNVAASATNNKPCVDITNNSKFIYRKGTGSGVTLISTGTSSTCGLSITNNSSAYLDEIAVVTNVATTPAIIVDNHSSLVGIGDGTLTYASTAAGATDACVHATNHSSVTLTSMKLVGNALAPCIGVKATNLSSFYGKALTGANLEGNGSFVIDFNSKAHLDTLNNPGANFSATGYTTGGTSAQNWATITSTPFIYPIQGGLATTWDGVKGCVVTYSS